ncbi:hypothetical protein FF124_06035 [Martelella lutilitoris]|uniref:TolC family protein n=1 Tax=Martelella lutilitoris TaxID=2583532 RepID=A0A5C4JTB4_9HYPH|nr:TolC family protein [Martelella lutilitoris]TNB48685.1 hypothetical protein FF124_06035 [Martelella lutilitoris]
MGAAALSGCASSQLKETVQRIDVMEAELNAPPPDPPDDGKALGPSELLTSANARGKDFMRARIARARAVLDLDKVKSARYPRVSAEARQISTFNSDFEATDSVSNIVLGVNWDISRALLRLDRKTVKVAGRLIPVQYQVAQRNATRELLDTYNDYTALDFQRETVALKRKALQCRVDDLEVEVALGNSSAMELETLKDEIDTARREAMAVSRSLASKRDELLGLSGLAEGGYAVAPGRSLTAALAGYPKATSENAEACFARSGKKRLEDLLVEAAAAQLEIARQSRFTRLTTSIPSFMTQTGGFNLQFLISYVLPIIDEGDALRMTQEARLTLLDTILTARDNRRAFMSDFDSLKLGIAGAESELAAASSVLARAETLLESADPAERCTAANDVQKARADVRAARYKIERLKADLRLLCAPPAEKTDDVAGAATQ